MKRLFCSTLLLSLCVSCQSGPTLAQYYESVPIGTPKAEVVVAIGSPFHTYRRNSIDHWVYKVPNERGGTTQRELQFENGLLKKKVTPGDPKDADFKTVD